MKLSQISIYVPEDIKEGLKQLAEENYQMFSDYVRLILTKHVKENLKKDKKKD
jgi:predicted DNA-binding protein